MGKIFDYNDLLSISNLLLENGYNYDNLTIEIDVPTLKMLNRLNDDFFFKSGIEDNKRVKNVRDFSVNMNGVKFRYICRNNDDGE